MRFDDNEPQIIAWVRFFKRFFLVLLAAFFFIIGLGILSINGQSSWIGGILLLIAIIIIVSLIKSK